YGAIQGAYWMYFGAIMSFASVFLLGKNYTNSEIGVILAAASILAVFLQPLLADAADKSQKASLMCITGIIVIGLLIATITLYIFPTKSLILSIIFILLGAWLTSLQPIINSMAFYLSRSGYVINFGVTRSGGSVAYAVLCLILGSLVADYGIKTIPAIGMGILILLLLSLLATDKLYKRAISSNAIDSNIKKVTQGSETISLKAFITRNKIFLVFTIGIVLVFFQNSVLNTYLMQIITAVGGNSSQMGQLFFFMALLELPGLFFFSQIRKRFSCQFLLKVASVAFVFKVFLTYMAPSVGFIYLAFLFQLISFPIFLSASVYLVDEVMEKGEAVKGQSFITGMITLSNVFASLMGGVILDLSGASLLLMISTILAVMGTGIVILTVGRIKPKDNLFKHNVS
ncbi:MAG TPA: MFS transporter, partial [Anaerovoracaceae bacterium]|nr:MFS transporter [Anaerovoracaceae bacterium]